MQQCQKEAGQVPPVWSLTAFPLGRPNYWSNAPHERRRLARAQDDSKRTWQQWYRRAWCRQPSSSSPTMMSEVGRADAWFKEIPQADAMD